MSTPELKNLHHYLFIENRDEVVREMLNSKQKFPPGILMVLC
jgi:hypothetical protein